MDAKQPDVFIDPADTGRGWLFVIIEAATGVTYSHQYGGRSTRHASIEGYLVPVFSDNSLAELRHIFEEELRGAGLGGNILEDNLLTRIRQQVAEILFWKSSKEDETGALKLDGSRLPELDEAFIPVVSLDGKGFLVWQNSD